MSPAHDEHEAFYRALGARIRTARRRASLTQAALAEQVGLSRTSVTNIESGKQMFPVHTLAALAAALHVSMASLLTSSTPQMEMHGVADLLDDLAPEEREWIRQIRGQETPS